MKLFQGCKCPTYKIANYNEMKKIDLIYKITLQMTPIKCKWKYFIKTKKYRKSTGVTKLVQHTRMHCGLNIPYVI